MRLTLIAALFGLTAFFATPAEAGHRHSRNCGHYSRGVSVSVVTPYGGGSYYSNSRYRRGNSRDRYYDKRYYKQRRKYEKRRAKAYRRGAYCPRY